MRTLLGVLGLCALAGPAMTLGQQKTSFRRYSGPAGTIELDLDTGVITRGPTVKTLSAATASTFPNLDLGGFVGVDTGF